MKDFWEENVLNQDYLLLHQTSYKNNEWDDGTILCFMFHKKSIRAYILSGRSEANYQSGNRVGNIWDLDYSH